MRLPIVVAVAMAALFFPMTTAPASALDELVRKHAQATGVPEQLIRRVIHIESRGNPRAVNRGNFGLMQIRLGTARAMGYRGNAQGLLDADTNMTFAVRYLAGAYRAARGDQDRAIRHYQRGYYYEAKRQGFSPYKLAGAQSTPASVPAPIPARVERQAAKPLLPFLPRPRPQATATASAN